MKPRLPSLPFRSQSTNMRETERWLRVAAGLIGTPLAYLLLARDLGGWLAVVAQLGFLAVGLDLTISGIRGFCPIYRYVAAPWATRAGQPPGARPSREPDTGADSRAGPRAGSGPATRPPR